MGSVRLCLWSAVEAESGVPLSGGCEMGIRDWRRRRTMKGPPCVFHVIIAGWPWV